MSENKTKEEILKEEYEKMVAERPGHNWGAWENEHDSVAIGIRAMTRFSDQEKRSTAIAFQEWAADRGWLLHPDCDEDEERAWYKPSDNFDIPDELMFGGQLYDIFINSL